MKCNNEDCSNEIPKHGDTFILTVPQKSFCSPDCRIIWFKKHNAKGGSYEM